MKLNAELKIRIDEGTKRRLQIEAGNSQKEVSEYVRGLLQLEQTRTHDIGIAERIERFMTTLAPMLRPRVSSTNEALLVRVARIEVIAEEVAMQQSPQIMNRVNQRLKTQSAAKAGGRDE